MREVHSHVTPRRALTSPAASGVAEGADRFSAGLARPRLSTVASYLAMLGSVLVVYLPVVVVPYAFLDDYANLAATKTGTWDLWASWAEEGRVLNGILSQAAFSAANSIDDLRLVRLVGLLGIGTLIVLLRQALVRAGVGGFVAALAATGRARFTGGH
jgi:hypothetical protein